MSDPIKTEAPTASPQSKILDILSADERAPTPAKSVTAPATDTPANDNPDNPALGDRQPLDGTTDKPDAKPEAAGTGKDGEGDEAKPLSQDELDQKARSLLNLTPKEPNTADHWKKKYDASSTEGKTLAQRAERLNARLKELGLKVFDSGEKADLVADEQYVASKTDSLVKTMSLSQEDKDLALDDPDKFKATIIERVLKATARPQPTVSASDIKIADSAKSLLRNELVNAKGADGKPELPDFEALEPYVNNLVADAITPEGFKKFMDSSEANYKYALGLLYAKVHQRVAPLIAEQLDRKAKLAAKKEAAKNDASLTSDGTRTGRTRKTSSESDEGREVALAKPVF